VIPASASTTDTSLDALLRPRSVAIVGASDTIHKIGGRPLLYLRQQGFAGPIFAVNPNGGTVQGLACHRSLDDLPEAPNAVIVAVSAQHALEQIEASGRVGARAVVLFSSGFAEIGEEGARRQLELHDAARRAGVRLLGPNTIGIANFACGAVLSFASIYQDFAPEDGPVAIVSQSGAVGAAVYASLRENGIGVRYVGATGNQADIDVCDLTSAILDDRAIRLLLLYLEEARDLAELDRVLARARTLGVPVLLLQGGRQPSGIAMARHHTGAAGTHGRALAEVLAAHACREVSSVPELAASAPLYLVQQAAPGGSRRIGIVSNSGASCVLAADACDDDGFALARLSEATAARLDALLPSFSRSRNPVDLTAMLLADPSLLGRALAAVLDDDGCDALALSLMAVAGASYDLPRLAADTAQAAREHGKPLVFSAPDARVRAAFAAQGVAVFQGEREALDALARHAAHRAALAA